MLNCAWLLLFLLGNIGPALYSQTVSERFYRLAGSATNGKIRTFIEHAGGTPIIERDSVLFLTKSFRGFRPYMIADFNQWDSTRGTMVPIANTDWFFRFDRVSPDARIEYVFKFAELGEMIDSLNPRRVLSFDIETSEFNMPGFKDSRLIRNDRYRMHGQLKSDSIYSRVFHNKRALFIYEPPGYRAGMPYPVILFKDGTSYTQRLKVHQIMDSLITAGSIPPAIGLFVNSVLRGVEYQANPDHRKFIVQELLPFFEAKYKSSGYSVIGSSRGALAAADLAMHHPEIFGKCAGISPAFRPFDLADRWMELKPRTQKVMVIESRYDADWAPDARLWQMALQVMHTPHVYWEIPQGHNQEAWSGVIDEVLIELFK